MRVNICPLRIFCMFSKWNCIKDQKQTLEVLMWAEAASAWKADILMQDCTVYAFAAQDLWNVPASGILAAVGWEINAVDGFNEG